MKKRISLLIVTFCMLFMVGCGNRVEETTMYYSMVTSPSEYYIRLEDDGDFVNNAGLGGTYTLKDGKVSFTDSVGGTTYGYLVGDKYLFYMSYDGNDNVIPDSDKFDVVVYDNNRYYHGDCAFPALCGSGNSGGFGRRSLQGAESGVG